MLGNTLFVMRIVFHSVAHCTRVVSLAGTHEQAKTPEKKNQLMGAQVIFFILKVHYVTIHVSLSMYVYTNLDVINLVSENPWMQYSS